MSRKNATATTKMSKKKSAGYGRILGLLRSNSRNILYIFLSGAILIVPTAMTPVFKGIFVDNVLTDGLTEWLPVLLGLMLVMSLIAGVLTWLQKNTLLKLANSIEISGAANYIWRLFHAPMDLFSRKDSYTLLSQANASRRISKVLTRDVINLLFALVNVVFYLIMMLQVDRLMTVVAVGLVLLSYAAFKGKEALTERFAPKEDGPSAYNLSLEDDRICSAGLHNIETFKSTASEGLFFQRLLGSKQAIVNARRDSDYSDAYFPLEELPEIIFLNLLLLISALRIMNKDFTIGNYLTFEAYASMFFYPLSQVIDGKKLFDKSEKRLKNLYKALDSAEAGQPPREMPPGGGKLDGYLEFRNVSFSYDGDRPLLRDFNLCIRPGQRVALVGKSGAGKSTIIKLAQGLYEPCGGTVTIDGISPCRMDRVLYVSSVGSANQEITLFAASIRDNITMWDDTVAEMDIARAASVAHIHDYIASLDDGYNHELSERGSNLSGGQQQKLEIARAMLYNPTIVFLDEATSSIDHDTREEIEAELKRRGCTCLVATHLLSYVTDYDEIIVLDQGKVIARGNHKELLERSEYYASAFEAEREVCVG